MAGSTTNSNSKYTMVKNVLIFISFLFSLNVIAQQKSSGCCGIPDGIIFTTSASNQPDTIKPPVNHLGCYLCTEYILSPGRDSLWDVFKNDTTCKIDSSRGYIEKILSWKYDIDSSKWQLFRIQDTFLTKYNLTTKFYYYFKIYRYGIITKIIDPEDSVKRWKKRCEEEAKKKGYVCEDLGATSDLMAYTSKSYCRSDRLMTDCTDKDTIAQKVIIIDDKGVEHHQYFIGGIFGECVRTELITPSKPTQFSVPYLLLHSGN